MCLSAKSSRNAISQSHACPNLLTFALLTSGSSFAKLSYVQSFNREVPCAQIWCDPEHHHNLVLVTENATLSLLTIVTADRKRTSDSGTCVCGEDFFIFSRKYCQGRHRDTGPWDFDQAISLVGCNRWTKISSREVSLPECSMLFCQKKIEGHGQIALSW